MAKASIGSISHGTLRSGDLIPVFAAELARLQGTESDDLVIQARAIETLLDYAWELDGERLSELVNELQDALNGHAPPYCYFGANEGDGSDFGFWPDMSAIEELPHVKDPADVPELGSGEDCVFVNDHGNVTVYGGDGKVIWDCV